jgi:hypothetical protein
MERWAVASQGSAVVQALGSPAGAFRVARRLFGDGGNGIRGQIKRHDRDF